MKFVISQKPEGAYQFALKDTQGKQILWSPRYATKGECRRGIEHLCQNLSGNIEVDQWQTDSGRYLFHLRSHDGRLLAMSSPFSSKHECFLKISEVRENLCAAVEEDVTIVFHAY
ncbi:DUF1508 domain-containing protein [Geofilum rubicundum]|uniref:Uncharacterized protein n=1 Tax=Geofilum rubicundum JCM 15548 TaxID=1236989 RepID=A0A0E9M0W0_9BACT|nr:DUF1508 domain-containing protein [Geofilum rubicundum]GAO30780.1 hypothetical protein JCM15548_13089 [Geofilum rubicundum JCM 15548]